MKTMQEFPDLSLCMLVMQYTQRCGNRMGWTRDYLTQIASEIQVLQIVLLPLINERTYKQQITFQARESLLVSILPADVIIIGGCAQKVGV